MRPVLSTNVQFRSVPNVACVILFSFSFVCSISKVPSSSRTMRTPMCTPVHTPQTAALVSSSTWQRGSRSWGLRCVGEQLKVAEGVSWGLRCVGEQLKVVCRSAHGREGRMGGCTRIRKGVQQIKTTAIRPSFADTFWRACGCTHARTHACGRAFLYVLCNNNITMLN